MGIITSVQNPLIKVTKRLQQRKYRTETGNFLVEGVRMAEEAIAADACEMAFYSDSLLVTDRGRNLLLAMQARLAPQGALFEVSPHVLQTLAETETPQGVVEVCRQRQRNLTEISLAEKDLILIADSIQEPGNLGTIIRTAWCAGASAMICLTGTVDPYNGKTVRASMGGIFNIPVITGQEWKAVWSWCQQQHTEIVVGAFGGKSHYSLNYAERVALVIGNEGQGLTHVSPGQADKIATIPLAPGAESLNAAVACGILAYEILRQRSLQRSE